MAIRKLPLFLLAFVAASCAQKQEVKRPRILGVAHIALYVSDLSKARAFYEDFLGFEEPISLERGEGSVRIALVKVNDKQYLELYATP